MSTTVTLTATASAFIDSNNPDTNQHAISSATLDYRGTTALLLAFPAIASAYQYKGFFSVFRIYGSGSSSLYNWHIRAADYVSFDPDTVTWATIPEDLPAGTRSAGTGQNSWNIVSGVPAAPALSGTWLCVVGAGTYNSTVEGSAGTNKPVIEITFDDDDASRTLTGVSPADGSFISGAKAQTFSWTGEQTAPTITAISQASAVLRYKKPADANWTEINISGSAEEYTFAANTLPTGKLLWQVQITDILGNVSTSETTTIYIAHRLNCSSAGIISRQDPDSNSVYNPNTAVWITKTAAHIVARFPDIPSNLLYKKLVMVDVSAGVRNLFDDNEASSRVLGLLTDVNPSAVTYNTMPECSYPFGDPISGRGIYGHAQLKKNASNDYPETSLINYYVFISVPTPAEWPRKLAVGSKAMLSSHCVVIDTDKQSCYIKGDIVMDIAVDDTVTVLSQVEQQNSPTSGWVNPDDDQTFSWVLTYAGDYPCPGQFVQASGSFFWREQGDENWNEVQASGSTRSVTIPANTFPGGTIEWYVEATDTNGTTTNTPTYTISTEDTIPTATPRDPVNVPVTGNKPVEFRWTVANDSGTQPTASDLQISTDGSTWTDLTTVSGSGKTYTAPANTFSPGTVYWRVRAYNRDGVAGSWSSAASFLCISASAPPVVTVEAVPFATVNWQGSGQQAYRITVDGTLYGPFFGTDKTYTLDEPLADGQHTVTVEIQNLYGLWSDPGSATFQVTNVPGAAVTLTGGFGVDAQLSWTTESTADDYLIYRSGVRIGHTTQKTFTDRLQLGESDWNVLNRLANGNYTRSNTVIGTTEAATCWITTADGSSDWIELKLTQRSQTEQNYSYQRVHSLRHVSGAALPVLELSSYENRTASFDTAFLTAEDARAFENLRGRVVILKVRNEEIVIGALTTIRKTTGDFYRAYEFTVSRIHWEDYIDDQNS